MRATFLAALLAAFGTSNAGDRRHPRFFKSCRPHHQPQAGSQGHPVGVPDVPQYSKAKPATPHDPPHDPSAGSSPDSSDTTPVAKSKSGGAPEGTNPQPDPQPEGSPAGEAKEKRQEKEKVMSSPGETCNALNASSPYAITYSPFDDSGACNSAEAITAHIENIAKLGFRAVRLYAPDCDGILNVVGKVCKARGLRMIVGMFMSEAGCEHKFPSVDEQFKDYEQFKYWDLVDLAVIGNESVFNGKCTVDQLVSMIGRFRSAFKGPYSGPITTSETINEWVLPEFKSKICPVVDSLGANMHPFFNPELTDPGEAGPFLLREMDRLGKQCPGKPVASLESGWPKKGTWKGVSKGGVDAQKKALRSMLKAAGDKTCFFQYNNNMWKQPGECGCENDWGVVDAMSCGK